MAHCTVCEQYHPFALTGLITCDGCQTELEIAKSTIAAAIVIPLFVIVPGAVLPKPLIGEGGIIAPALVVGQLLPLIMFKLFFKLEARGTSLQLSDPRRD